MPSNPSRFHRTNVTDTCAVWNVLSSFRLYSAASQAGCSFCCTAFVRYECLDKPRRSASTEEQELQQRLRKAISRREIVVCPLEVDDLLEVECLEKRKRLDKGELSSMALAKRLQQGFMTDDQGARDLAEAALSVPVQTTPHLLGWLFFTERLTDADKDIVIAEHQAVQRPLSKFFEVMYLRALEYRQMASAQRHES